MSGGQLQQQTSQTKTDAGEERVRDLLGRTNAQVKELTERLSALEDENKSLREEVEMAYPDRSTQFEESQEYAAPPVAPAPQMGIWRDPRTGILYQVPVAPTLPEPVAAPQRQPASKNDRYEQLNSMYNKVCNDLEYHGKLHPEDAQALATDIMHRHERTGKPVEVIQREMSRSNPVIKSVLKAQVEALANYTGAKVVYEDAAATPPQAQTPATPAQMQQEVVVEETPGLQPPKPSPEITDANVAPAGLSTERNSVPPTVNTSKTAKQKYDTVADTLDSSFTG